MHIFPNFIASNQANLSVSPRPDPVFDSSHCVEHAHAHTSGRVEGEPRTGVVGSWLINSNPHLRFSFCMPALMLLQRGFPRRPDCPRGCPRRSDDNWAAFTVNRAPPGRCDRNTRRDNNAHTHTHGEHKLTPPDWMTCPLESPGRHPPSSSVMCSRVSL